MKDAFDAKLAKRQLRIKMKRLLFEIPETEKSTYTSHLNHRLIADINNLFFGKSIGLFAPLADEPNIFPAIFRMLKDCQIYLPHFEKQKFIPITKDSNIVQQLESYSRSNRKKLINLSKFEEQFLTISNIKLHYLLVPGLAFAKKSEGYTRLGRGGGWYDRLLTTIDKDITTIGICYPQQLLAADAIPTEPHDQLIRKIYN